MPDIKQKLYNITIRLSAWGAWLELDSICNMMDLPL